MTIKFYRGYLLALKLLTALRHRLSRRVTPQATTRYTSSQLLQSQTGGQADFQCAVCARMSAEELKRFGEKRPEATGARCPAGHRICEIHSPEHAWQGDAVWFKCRVCGAEWGAALGAAP